MYNSNWGKVFNLASFIQSEYVLLPEPRLRSCVIRWNHVTGGHKKPAVTSAPTVTGPVQVGVCASNSSLVCHTSTNTVKEFLAI